MIYTMILIGCRLFQRADEVLSLQYSSLELGLSVMNIEGIVRGIAVTFQGKTDKVPVTLILWADDSNPEFCPVRHLLVYIYLLGAKDGFLFPCYDSMIKLLRGDALVAECVSYDTFLSEFKRGCIQTLSTERPGAVWGLHSLRKTGYAFGVWGNAPFTELKAAARHSTDKDAMKYTRDAATLKAIAEENGTLMSIQWKCPFVQDRQAALSLNQNIGRLPITQSSTFLGGHQ